MQMYIDRRSHTYTPPPTQTGLRLYIYDKTWCQYYINYRSCEVYVFTCMCLSMVEVLGPEGGACSQGVPGPGGAWSGGCLVLGGAWSWGMPGPGERRLLLRTVRILLECILVTA